MTINAAKFREVADLIEAHPDHFNMASWVRNTRRGLSTFVVDLSEVLDCGTTACICGWTNAIYNTEVSQYDRVSGGDVENAARELGVDKWAADRFFMMQYDSPWGVVFPDLFEQEEDGEWVKKEDSWNVAAPYAVILLRMIADGEVEL